MKSFTWQMLFVTHKEQNKKSENKQKYIHTSGKDLSFSMSALWSSAGNLSLSLIKVNNFNLCFTKGHQINKLSH